MTINQLQYFVAVCEYGTISKASEVLHISAPSISLAIKELETQFNVKLFDRSTKQLKLSQEGRYMYESAKEILASINTLEVQMEEFGRNQSQASISIPIQTGSYLLNQYTNGLRKAFPDIPFVIRQSNAENALSALYEGSSDIAFVVGNENLPANLEARELFSSEFVFCVSKSNPFSSRKVIDLIDLKDEPIILSQESSYMSRILKKEFYKANTSPKILMYAVQLPMIRDIVSSGEAGAFLMREIAESLPNCSVIELREKIPISFYLIWRKDRYHSKNIKTIVNYILEQAEYMKQNSRE